MIDDLPLRWLVTGLCLLSGLGFALVIDRRSPASIVSHGLHLVMALAMAVMAWPAGLRLPGTPAEVLFLAGALWFVMTAVLAARAVAQRLVRAYHALTMLAMSWMYAVVHDPHGPDQPVGAHHHHHPHQHEMPPDPAMPNMPDMTAPSPHPGGDGPGWIDAGNWIWTLIFVVAAVVWCYLLATRRRASRRRRSSSWRRTLGIAGQTTMAAAMAIMFGALLTQG